MLWKLTVHFVKKVFKSAEGLDYHEKTVHEKYFSCSMCSRTFPGIMEYRIHNQSEQHKTIQMKLRKSKVSENEIRHECDSCKRTYLSKRRLKTHISKCSVATGALVK